MCCFTSCRALPADKVQLESAARREDRGYQESQGSRDSREFLEKLYVKKKRTMKN